MFKSLVSSMITQILLSLQNPGKYIEKYEQMTTDILWRGRPGRYRKEILEHPSKLGGLQLHDIYIYIYIYRFTISLKTTWIRRFTLTNSGWTDITNQCTIEKIIIYGTKYLTNIINDITNPYWNDVLKKWMT